MFRLYICFCSVNFKAKCDLGLIKKFFDIYAGKTKYFPSPKQVEVTERRITDNYKE